MSREPRAGVQGRGLGRHEAAIAALSSDAIPGDRVAAGQCQHPRAPCSRDRPSANACAIERPSAVLHDPRGWICQFFAAVRRDHDLDLVLPEDVARVGGPRRTNRPAMVLHDLAESPREPDMIGRLLSEPCERCAAQRVLVGADRRRRGDRPESGLHAVELPAHLPVYSNAARPQAVGEVPGFMKQARPPWGLKSDVHEPLQTRLGSTSIRK